MLQHRGRGAKRPPMKASERHSQRAQPLEEGGGLRKQTSRLKAQPERASRRRRQQGAGGAGVHRTQAGIAGLLPLGAKGSAMREASAPRSCPVPLGRPLVFAIYPKPDPTAAKREGRREGSKPPGAAPIRFDTGAERQDFNGKCQGRANKACPVLFRAGGVKRK